MSPQAERGRRVIVGRVAGAHGIAGEIRVQILGEGPDLLLGAKRLALSRSGPDDASAVEYESEGGSTGRVGEVRLALRGVADRDAAESLRGSLVMLEASELPPLPPGQHYWFELVGCVVESASGARVGVVSDLWDTGAAHDVLVVEDEGGKQRLFPFVKALLRELDVAGRRIVLEDAAGLTDPI